MPIIEIPDGSVIEFPDDMDTGEIQKFLDAQFGGARVQPPPPTFAEDLKANWPQYAGATAGALVAPQGVLPTVGMAPTLVA